MQRAFLAPARRRCTEASPKIADMLVWLALLGALLAAEGLCPEDQYQTSKLVARGLTNSASPAACPPCDSSAHHQPSIPPCSCRRG